MIRSSRLRVVLAFIVAAVAATAGLVAQPKQVAAAACGIPTCTLTIQLQGNGSGSWKTTSSTGSPNGFIDCQIVKGVQAPGSVCSHVYGGEDRATPLVIYYAGTPAPGSKVCSPFSGVCTTSAQAGQFTLSATTTLKPTFTLQSYAVQVATAGSGAGTVTSTPAGIVCPGYGCSANFDYGTELTLTATPANGSSFDGWMGVCFGQAAACHFTVDGLMQTSATFVLGSPPTAGPPAPTPTATARAVATVTPTKPPVAATAAPHTTPGASNAPQPSAPSTTAEPDASPGSTSSETEVPASPGGPPTAFASPPAGSASAPSADLTPIVLAILGAGLLVALGIGFAAFLLVRRHRSTS